jgi:hypothetical protein
MNHKLQYFREFTTQNVRNRELPRTEAGQVIQKTATPGPLNLYVPHSESGQQRSSLNTTTPTANTARALKYCYEFFR